MPICVIDQCVRPHECLQVEHPNQVDVGDHRAGEDSDQSQCVRAGWLEEKIQQWLPMVRPGATLIITYFIEALHRALLAFQREVPERWGQGMTQEGHPTIADRSAELFH